jgi:hypothetical protein
MSVSTIEPRSCCIRCGGIEFRVIEKWSPSRRSSRHFDRGSASDQGACLTVDLASLGVAVIKPIDDGAYI